METRSSHILVGAVVLVLAVALFAFILWLARYDREEQALYDIFFENAAGLARGSAVNFTGVPVGQVQNISLLPSQPDRVRVRIAISPETPILQGTTASVEGVGFTGVSIVSLEGAVAGTPPITEPGPFGAPVIPTKPGALEGLLQSAPELLNNASALLTNLNEVLNQQNQQRLAELLDNLNTTTESFAQRSPEIAATLAEARTTLQQAGDAAEQVGNLAATTDRLVEQDGAAVLADLRETTQRANRTLAEVERTAAAVRPGVEQLTSQTLPQTGLLVRELRDVTSQLGAIASKLDEDPAGALVGGRRLPDYTPAEVAEAGQ